MALTRNSDVTTCRDETAMFTCNVTTPVVRWVAGPDVTVLITNASARVGDTVVSGADNTIIMTIISTSPLVTTMTISGNLTDDLVVGCGATNDGVRIMQEERLIYRAGSKLNSVKCYYSLIYHTPYAVCIIASG